MSWTTWCDRCDKMIEPKVPHVTMTRHVEQWERRIRGGITVLDAEILSTLCMDCAPQSTALVDWAATAT